MNATEQDTRLAELTDKVDRLTNMVATLAERSARQQEFLDEMAPIVKDVVRVGVERFDVLEHRGYFTFGTEALAIVDRIVTTYGADDVRQLGDNVVRILDTVRRVTQPDVLAIAQDATQALARIDDVEPKGVLGMLRETRDDDIRRGVAMLLEVLRYVGRGTARAAAETGAPMPAREPAGAGSDAQARLARMLGPSKARSAPAAAPASAPAASPTAAPAAAPAAASAAAAPAAALDMSCTLVPDGEWTREWASARAAELGVTALTDDHWKVVEYARTEFLQSGSSPNIRKIATSSGVDTRTIYALWPSKPGVATAYVAGIPKPGGCL